MQRARPRAGRAFRMIDDNLGPRAGRQWERA